MAIGTWSSLTEAQKLTEDMKIKGVIEEIIKDGGLLPRLPGLTVRGKSVVYNREKTIPTGNFIAIDGSLTPQTVVDYEEVTVALKIIECTIDLDHFLVDTYPTLNDLRAQGISAARKGFQNKLEDAIIYASSAVANEFNGLHRLIGTHTDPNAQVIHNGTAGAGGARGTPNALPLLKLDELIDLVKPAPSILLMSRQVARRLSQALRLTGVSGNIDFAVDEFGKRIAVYAGIPVVASDFLTQTEQLAVNGKAYDGKTGGTSSTIFALRFDLPDDGGVSLLTGGGEVIMHKSIPQLEGRLAGREILYTYVAVALGAKVSCAAMTGVANAQVVSG